MSLPLIVFACIRSRLGEDRGAGLVEYILLVILIALVAFAAINLLGNAASDQFNSISNQVNNPGA